MAPDLAPDSEAADVLRRGLVRLGIALPEERILRLMAYLRLMMHWNRAYNLTAIRAPLELVRRHLLDALSVDGEVRGPRVLDVGSGAGVPGLVLAIARPQLCLWLLDPSLKRTRFLSQALHELPVSNARVVRARLDALPPAQCFDTVLSRATLALEVLVPQAAPHLSPGGRILAMLGRGDPGLERRFGDRFRVQQRELAVPGTDAARHVALFEPIAGCAGSRAV